MPEEKKRKKSKTKKLEKTEESKSDKKDTALEKNTLPEQIKNACEGLYYLSETDAEVLPFVGSKSESLSKEVVLSQTKSAADSPIEERDFAGFFARLTEIQDWFGNEETETAKKYARLKELLENNLRNLKVFKIGKIQIDVYAVGLDAENSLLGVKTKAIET